MWFDGESLVAAEVAPGRALPIDARCLGGRPVRGAFAHVCALVDEEAAFPYDDPAVQGARRDALGWWIPLLGDSLVCLSTVSLDAVRCAGAITVTRDPSLFGCDPFARLFPGTVVASDLFASVLPPAGPVIERYAGAPWPAGRF